jgi:hypothetical protein
MLFNEKKRRQDWKLTLKIERKKNK